MKSILFQYFVLAALFSVNFAQTPVCPTCASWGYCDCPSQGYISVKCSSCIGGPTYAPSKAPTYAPSKAPTHAPSSPTIAPTIAPSSASFAGELSTIAGSYANGVGVGYAINNGPATSAIFGNIQAMASDIYGNIYVCDESNHIVRMVIQSTGIIVTVAGIQNSAGQTVGVGGVATNSQLNNPNGITIDSSGNLYISDHTNYAIRKISFGPSGPVVAGVGTGTITTVVGALGSSGTALGAATSTAR